MIEHNAYTTVLGERLIYNALRYKQFLTENEWKKIFCNVHGSHRWKD